MTEPSIQYAKTSDGVSIAYAASGSGPPFVKAANWLTHLEFDRDSPVWRHWLRELSRDHTFVRYDERGCGLSDREVDFSFEAWVRDLEAVIDALGPKRFPLLGISQGGAVAITYAVRHPERVSHLILYGAYARGYDHRGLTPEQQEELEATLTLMRHGWGRDDPSYRQIFTSGFIPGATAEQMSWFNDLQRVSTSAENAVRLMETVSGVNVEDLLPQVGVPTLVLHVRGDRRVPFEEGRRLATVIDGARFVPLEGQNHLLLEDEEAWQVFLREVRAFLGVADTHTGARDDDVSPVTVLFTDIVGHTEMMSRLGDERGREVLREHERITREVLAQHGGTEVKTMGDGFMASFASVTRAVECAISLQQAFAKHDGESISIRVGLNAGEPIEEDGDLFGATVILASRIAAKAEGREILVSDNIRSLSVGKGFLFSDRGDFLAKGFEEPVRVYEVNWRE